MTLKRDVEQVCWEEFSAIEGDADCRGDRIRLLELIVKIRTSRVPVNPQDEKSDPSVAKALHAINKR